MAVGKSICLKADLSVKFALIFWLFCCEICIESVYKTPNFSANNKAFMLELEQNLTPSGFKFTPSNLPFLAGNSWQNLI